MLALQNPQLFRQQAYINGQWLDANHAATLVVNNPATLQAIGTVPDMAQAETRQAIVAAQQAQQQWKQLTAKQRAQYLRHWFELMLKYQEDLARILTLEQGKPLAEARGEIAYAASFLEWFAEEAKRVYGDTIPSPQSNNRIIILKQPIGVAAAITPWNFPAAMITRKAGAALAAGCSMVLKPASQTPFSALALAALAEQAGIPAGVFNVVTGSASRVGAELVSNPIVRKLSFTGSTEVGRLLMRDCAHDIKKLSLELGGNAPFIVFEDADLDAAVKGAIAAKFRNSGQTCVCVNRFYVQAKIYDKFADKFTRAVAAIKVGDGFDEDVQNGPLIDSNAIVKLQEHISDAVEKGAQVAYGAKALSGNFFTPTILLNVPKNALIAAEETFGPVAALFSFDSDAEVVALANNTEYGLAAYFYSQNLKRIFKVAEELEYGMVGINTGLISTEVAPFGGVKSSGLGREGSKYGIDEYLEIKYLCLALD